MKESCQQDYEFGQYRILEGERLLVHASSGETVPLTPKSFDTLVYLVRNNDRVIPKDELMSVLWADTIVEENNLSQNISFLRRALGERRGKYRYIATIPGKGFKFIAKVAVVSSLPDSETTEKDSRQLRRWSKRKRFVILTTTFLVAVIASVAGTIVIVRDSDERQIGSVAVLPFKPLVADNRDPALEMGMADTLIARLVRNRNLVVRPLSSARRFNSLEQDPRMAGRALEVDSVLEGSVQRWGDTIRVNVRLLRVSDGSSIWSGTFDEKFTDIFAVQDAIAEKVSAALNFHLPDADSTGSDRFETENIEAYRFYLQGRYLSGKLTPNEILKGISFFQRAVEADPQYSEAFASMAIAYITLPVTSDVPSKEAFPKAKAAALKALEIDPKNASAKMALGRVAFWYEWDWKSAEEYFKESIELNPGSSEIHLAYAHLLSNAGRHDEALAEVRLARAIDPLSLLLNALEGQFLLYANRTEEAEEVLRRSVTLDPGFWVAHINLAKVLIRQKKYAEAEQALKKANQLSSGNSETLSLTGYAYAMEGREREARQIVAKLESDSSQKYVPPYNLALIYMGLEDKELMYRSLYKAYSDRDMRMTLLRVDTKWDDLRHERKFKDLVLQIGPGERNQITQTVLP